ncbi:MAG: hypothetical protein ACRCXC_03400 [Legionella sp.]
MTQAQSLREVAKNTYEQGKLGAQSVEQSIQGIKASEEKMRRIAQTILDLNKHTQQIGDITRVVNTLGATIKNVGAECVDRSIKSRRGWERFCGGSY